MRLIQFLAIMLTAFAFVPSERISRHCRITWQWRRQPPNRCALFGMKSSRESLSDKSGPSETAPVRLLRATEAGAFYAVIVFLIGFILGSIRVLLVVPRLGEMIAVIIEAPLILAASWFVCRWCVKRLNVTRTVPTRSLMGLVAFLVLMSAEVGLGAVLGRSLVDQLAAYGSAAGAIGLAAQVIFATFPVIQVWRR
jgi:hypothetical protein